MDGFEDVKKYLDKIERDSLDKYLRVCYSSNTLKKRRNLKSVWNLNDLERCYERVFQE